MLAQRGVPYNILSPFHSRRSRLVKDTTGEHRKHMIKCESHHVAAQAIRQARSTNAKRNQNSSLSVYFVLFTTANYDFLLL